MRTNKRLKKIEKNSFELGNDAYKTYKETKSLRTLKGAIEAYRTTMQSIRYQLLFNNLKKK
jgi:hypothetical protein